MNSIRKRLLERKYDDDDVEECYEQLESTVKEIPRKDLLIIQGDWNGKVGPDACELGTGIARRCGA